MSRPWRQGIAWEVEMDSLADRLIHDPEMRAEIVKPGRHWSDRVAKRAKAWQERAAKLAHDLEITPTEMKARIIERATEHVAERNEDA